MTLCWGLGWVPLLAGIIRELGTKPAATQCFGFGWNVWGMIPMRKQYNQAPGAQKNVQ